MSAAESVRTCVSAQLLRKRVRVCVRVRVLQARLIMSLWRYNTLDFWLPLPLCVPIASPNCCAVLASRMASAFL